MPRDDEHKFAKQPRLIRRPEVRERVGLSTSTLYEMIAAGDFPAPIPIGRQAVAWLESEVDAWIEQKIKQRDNRTHKHNAP
ncbi:MULTISPECIES: helix-turn-helix transcriptional regulator [Pseudomonadaceae]|uniref:helix-turn-helix transcriptional regulator n=1 Tax=Pseudomonadaceae TaxID=135621 RepID=UPI001C105A35|nr:MULTISPECIES: AlpA family transcriptional regulator [Pseudomonadaceae]MBU5713316.1 AlpA family transcriptional regulator [Pseudomonas aeruginosa]MBU5782442.1 AlpA family transcriptional regulator [Pseudomonas aeruginosa]MDH1590512.1 AlpA family transcriptional regulator [Stutzerimonas stutzeri]HBP6664557.1 AlpA family transcriptional regulator [Pseudomonas aeruginosa]HCK4965411.1 AlpA family transcriptional regulator [Pseudomonas aeruginosa]